MSQTSFLQARTARIVIGVVIGVFAVMWIYVLFIAKPATPDRLDDRSFPDRGRADLRGDAHRHAATPVSSTSRRRRPRTGPTSPIEPTRS